MSAARRRRLSIPIAIALMVCVGAWQPSMTLAHAAAPHAASTHHHGGGHVPPGSPAQTLPDSCCDACVAACGGCPALSSARALLTFATARAHEIPLPAARTLPRPASPHLHPLPLGPPVLRVA